MPLPRAVVLVATTLALCASTVVSAQDFEWVPVTPFPRIGHSAVYDAARDRILVFGGRNIPHDRTFSDVWEYSLGPDPGWKLLQPLGAPPARSEHTAIYDSNSDRMIVFGGRGSDLADRMNDVWALALGDGAEAWTELTPDGGPPRTRYNHTAVYDPVRDRMAVFGGIAAFEQTVWFLSLGASPEWTGVEPAAPVFDDWAVHSAVYDGPRDRMVIFGGQHGLLVGYKDDTWTLTLDDAPVLAPLAAGGGPPPARGEHAAIYDEARRRMLVFGGSPGVGDPFDDLWELSMPDVGPPFWSELAFASRPVARSGHTTVHDPLRDRMLVFGTAFDANHWQLGLGEQDVWSPLEPGPAFDHTAVFDPLRNRMIVYGGIMRGERTSETWTLSMGSHAEWRRVEPAGSTPVARSRHSAIYDSPRDRMVIYAGAGELGTRNDTHELVLSADPPTWSPIVRDGPAPPARYHHTAVLDAAHDRMVAFAGAEDGVGEVNTTWSLPLDAGPWSEMLTAGVPPADRQGHTTVYDPGRDRTYVFGGGDFFGTFNDLWRLSPAGVGFWTELLPPCCEPTARAEHQAIFDPILDRMIVYGGSMEVGGGVLLPSVYTLSMEDPPRWGAQLVMGVAPPPRRNFSAIHDVPRNRMVIFGGFTDAVTGSDVWALEWPGGPTPALASLVSARVEDGIVKLRWYAAGGGVQGVVLRAEARDDWARLATVVSDGSGVFGYDDAGVTAGGRYGYALEIAAEDGTTRTEPVWVDIPGAARLELHAARVTPEADALEVELSLGDAGDARLALFDVRGRRIAERTIAATSGGRQTVRFDVGSRLGRGVWFLRLIQGDEARHLKVVVTR